MQNKIAPDFAETGYTVPKVNVQVAGTFQSLPGPEVSASYNGGPWQFGVQLLDFRDDKVARERIYVTEGWEAPEWRAPWRSDTPADPPE